MARTSVLAAATVATLLLAAPLTMTTTPAQAATSPVPATLDSTTTRTDSVDIAVPRGVTPSAITGVLNMDQVPAGGIEFLVNDRVVERVPTTLYAKVRLPVGPGDVTAERTIGLSLRYAVPTSSGADCPALDKVGAILRKITLVHSGSEPAPDTIGTFFPETSPRVDIVVPADADADLLGAGLAAVAAVTARYPEDTEVVLTPTDGKVSSVGIGHRVVRLQAGGSKSSAQVLANGDVPTLAIEATGDPLRKAVQALAYSLDTFTDARTFDLAAEPAEPNLSMKPDFAQLGSEDVVLTGWGQTTAVVPVPLDAFAGPVDDLELTLQGIHTAIPAGASAQLDVFFNDTLVDSLNLAAPEEEAATDSPSPSGAALGDLEFRSVASIRTGALRGDNELRLVLTALPEGGCLPSTPITPIDVQIDTDLSALTATRGDEHAPGFAAFPQVLDGELEVGLRDSGDGLDAAAVRAARLVASLQQASTRLLEVRLVEADDLQASEKPGLLVGAEYTDSVALQTPIRLNGTRVLDMVDATVRAQSSEPIALLQASRVGDRHVLSLGSWGPGGDTTAPRLANQVTQEVSSLGWSGLRGDVLMAAANTPVTAITSDLAPRISTRQSDLQEESRSWLFWVFLVGILVLLALVLLQLGFAARRAWRYRREERRARRQDAAERPDGLISQVARGNRPDSEEKPPES